MSIRIHRSADVGWTKLANAVLRDANLTLRAKGLLAQLLSHDDGWQQSLAYAEKQCADGKATIRGAFGELVAAGYATRERHREADGKTKGWDYDVYEYPRFPAEAVDFPNVGETNVGPANVGETHLLEDSPSSRTPSTEQPQEQTLAPTPSTRQPDLIFEALFSLETGKIYDSTTAKILTPSARAALNKAVSEVKATGIGPGDLMHAIAAWGTVMGDATCTANAVAKHLPRLLAAAEGNVARAAQPSDEEKVLAELRRRRELKEASGG